MAVCNQLACPPRRFPLESREGQAPPAFPLRGNGRGGQQPPFQQRGYRPPFTRSQYALKPCSFLLSPYS